MTIHISSTIEEAPAIKSSHLPKTQKAIERFESHFEVIFNTDGPFNYVNYLDFVVGEVLGTAYRELCYKYYYKQGKQLHNIFGKKRIKTLDDNLAFIIKECCNQTKEPDNDLLSSLRSCADTANEYENTDQPTTLSLSIQPPKPPKKSETQKTDELPLPTPQRDQNVQFTNGNNEKDTLKPCLASPVAENEGDKMTIGSMRPGKPKQSRRPAITSIQDATVNDTNEEGIQTRFETGNDILQNGSNGVYLKAFTFEERNVEGVCSAQLFRVSSYEKSKHTGELRRKDNCTLSPNKCLKVMELMYSWFNEDYRNRLRFALDEIDEMDK